MLKSNTVANICLQIIALERQLSELIKVAAPDKASRLGRAIDLLTGARACEFTGCADLECARILHGNHMVNGQALANH